MSALTNTFTCGPRCDNINVPCIARRQRDCDGQEDPILRDIIPRGRGWCLDGRCYKRSSINQFNNRDPFTRRPFQFPTEEQRAEYNRRRRERWRNMTAEQRAEYNRRRRERRARMTAEQRAVYNMRQRERRARMTAEQREEYLMRRRARERERRFRMLQERRMRD